MLAPDALHAEVDEEERHEQRPQRPVQDGVHAAREAALAKAGEIRGLPLCRGVLHALRYTAPDGAVTVGSSIVVAPE